GARCSVTSTSASFATANFAATYSGSSTHPATSATSNVITVQKDNTSTAVACSPSTIILGATSSCTATVTDTTTVSNTPTGSVTFTSSNTAVGTVGASCTLVSGRCSVTFADVSRGTAIVSASYGGDS